MNGGDVGETRANEPLPGDALNEAVVDGRLEMTLCQPNDVSSGEERTSHPHRRFESRTQWRRPSPEC